VVRSRVSFGRGGVELRFMLFKTMVLSTS
jgi:hypothetical protein